LNRKKTLILFALSISLLSVSLIEVFSAPTSPYIKIIPENISDPTLKINSTFQISIYTDYTGSDIWGWQFKLTFNPAVLEGVSVSNGDLITTAKHLSARFSTKGFNNTEGTLGLTLAYFYYASPQTPDTTSGPGTLAYITFKVKDYGNSSLTLVINTPIDEVRLKGYDPVLEHYDIINGFVMPENIGHGYFKNTLPGDIDLDRDVDYNDFLAFAAAYLKTSGQPAYNPKADTDSDGDVDYNDFLTFAANYLKSW